MQKQKVTIVNDTTAKIEVVKQGREVVRARLIKGDLQVIWKEVKAEEVDGEVIVDTTEASLPSGQSYYPASSLFIGFVQDVDKVELGETAETDTTVTFTVNAVFVD